jgi:Mg-chelatase subunit ChlD
MTGALMLSASILPSYSQDSGSNVMFIFDSSGSMKKQIESGESRSEAAKRAMVKALSEMPSGTRLGLLMYGHRRAKDCTDIEIVSPIGTADGVGISASIVAARPKGETPIAAALERAASSFAPMAGQSNSIVLVTDGIEECGGDPCAAARAIREAGLGIKAHVVGFTLNEKQRQTVQCVADETGGKYFDAQDANGLSGALAEVQKVVAQEEPPPPKDVSIFADDFNGISLQPHWAVTNGSNTSHVVEDGRFLIPIHLSKSDLPEEQPRFTLEGVDLPAGNWTASTIVEFGIQTAQETFALSFGEAEPDVSAQLVASGDQYYGWKLAVRIEKKSGAEITGFDAVVEELGCNVCKSDRMLNNFMASLAQPIELQLVKDGRSYYARAREAGKTDWVTTDKVTLLKSGGKLQLSGSQRKANDGESYAFVDRLEILAPQQ